jgi:peroxiredoxin
VARTESSMLPLGTEAPPFTLPDAHGKLTSLSDYKTSKAILVMFICNHCPYVKLIANTLSEVTSEYLKKNIAVVAINSNDAENYPEDSADKMIEEKKNREYLFPYLIDSTQDVAKAYNAACTPDFFLFDNKFKLIYRGQFDKSRPGNGIIPDGEDLVLAMDAALQNKKVSSIQKPSLGCNIKWRNP